MLGLKDVSREEIVEVLDTAARFRAVSERRIKKVPTLRGRTVVMAFFENSTRTKLSFDLAAKRLSADGLSFSASSSSTKKGETLMDTARNLDAMRPDAMVIRHGAAGAPHLLAKNFPWSVINAGDGINEHPTQALLDMLTMRDHLGALEGKRVAIVGDIYHSRVARSNIYGLTKLGAEVGVCGPPTLMPVDIEELGVTVFRHVEEAIEWADVLNVLRLQLERMQGGYVPSLREYNRIYGVSRARLERASKELLILHPGPMNRGVEIDSDVADGPDSVILDQVTNGIAVRMAVLYLLAGGAPEKAESAKGGVEE
ncbi:MAG TPA: aspartate carbamoyltransferase [Gemmatimonadetes bacterium]|nr:aspartate carbamoyltransferase [Gemmatimonadota bacterium]